MSRIDAKAFIRELQSLKRWPGDGLEKDRHEHEKDHKDVANPCAVQVALTEILGGWPMEERLCDMDSCMQEIFLGMPFQIQKRSAFELRNYKAAAKHLFQVCDTDKNARKLLSRVKARSAVKYGIRTFLSWEVEETPMTPSGDVGARLDENNYLSTDPKGHHGIDLILACLVKTKEDNDNNLRLLFGDEMHVYGALMNIQKMYDTKAPPNSPAYLKQQQFFDEGKLKPVKTCANCLQHQSGSYNKCAGCRREVYCSRTCQRQHWKIHRVDCYRAQGKDVKEKWETEARQLLQAAEEAKNEESNLDMKARTAEGYNVLAQHANATGFDIERVYDCNGIAIVRDLCLQYNAELQLIGQMTGLFSVVEEVIFMVDPFGMGKGDRVMVLRSTQTSAFILCGFTKCCLYNGDGPFTGIFLNSIAVVKSNIPVPQERDLIERKKGNLCGGNVDWMEVAAPPYQLTKNTTPPICNNFTRVTAWLTTAVEKAVVETKDYFYHIGSQDSMKTRMGYTGP